jgi:hypothetical protein
MRKREQREQGTGLQSSRFVNELIIILVLVLSSITLFGDGKQQKKKKRREAKESYKD